LALYVAGWVVKPRVWLRRLFLKMSHLKENRYRKIKGVKCLNEHVTAVRTNAVATRGSLIYTT
jgi:hypothetical protein